MKPIHIALGYVLTVLIWIGLAVVLGQSVLLFATFGWAMGLVQTMVARAIWRNSWRNSQAGIARPKE